MEGNKSNDTKQAPAVTPAVAPAVSLGAGARGARVRSYSTNEQPPDIILEAEESGDVMYDDGIETVAGTGSAQSRSGRRKSNFMRSYSFGANGSVMPPVPNDIAAVWERIHKSVPRLPMNKANAALARSYSFEESVNAMRLQEQLRDAQRKLDKERNARTSLENKRSSLEQERTDLMQ